MHGIYASEIKLAGKRGRMLDECKAIPNYANKSRDLMFLQHVASVCITISPKAENQDVIVMQVFQELFPNECKVAAFTEEVKSNLAYLRGAGMIRAYTRLDRIFQAIRAFFRIF